MSSKQILVNLFAICLIAVLPHLGYTPLFSYALIIVLVVWRVLKNQDESFQDIGFSFKNFPKQSLWIGTLAAVLILSFMQLVFFPIFEKFVAFDQVDIGLYSFIKENIAQYLFIVVMGWVVGGVYEEIVFHGFIFTRLEKMTPSRHATKISFVLAGLIFGVYHYQLGMAGMINATIVGIVYLGLYVYFKRNLWYSIICHGVYNSIVMTLIYLDYL